MKLLIVLVVAIFVGSCYAKVGEDSCTWGPSYWCKDEASAKECSAIEYCRLNVWNTKDDISYTALSPAANSKSPQADLCDMCKAIVGYIKPLVDNNATEPEIQTALEDFCKLLGPYSNECSQYVREYLPMMFEILKQEVDTGELCQLLHLCNSTTRVVANPKMAPRANLCSICKVVANFLKAFVDANSSEEEAEKALDELCSLLPASYSTECKSLVDSYFPAIWALLKAELDSGQICEILKLCQNSTVGSTPTPPPQDPEADLCELCKQVVDFLKPFVDSNATEEEAEDALEKLCALLPGVGAECKALVDEYFPLIWKLVQSEIDSGELCKLIGLCPMSMETAATAPEADLCQLCKQVVDFLKPFVDSNSTEKEAQAALEKFCSLLPGVGAECKTLVDEYFPLIWKLVQSEIDSGKLCEMIGLCSKSMETAATSHQADLCDLCEMVTSFLKPYVDNNATEAEALAALEKVCGLFPSTYSKECDAFVKEYFPMIWKFLQAEIDSDQLCKLIGLCPSPSPVVSAKAPEADLCDDCKRVVSFLKPFVDSNATEAEAKAAVEEFCKLIPSIGSALCDLIIDKYFDDIWKYLQAEVDTDKICQQLHLCPSSVAVTAPDGIECDICELILKYAEAYLAKNATEAEIEAFLDKVCDYFPVGQSECKSLVQQYLPELVSFIENEIPPEKACQEIDLCSALMAAAAQPKGEVECELCTMVLKYVDAILTKNSSEAEIVALLDKVCHYFPAAIQQECVDLVNTYAKDIIPLIVQELDPEKICTMIGLCPKGWTNMKVTDKLCQQHRLCPSSVAVTAPDDIECDICDSILTYVYSVLAENATEGEIEAVLDKVCTIVPQVFAGLCKELVDKYTKELIQYILDKLPPDVICEKLGFCSSVKSAMEPRDDLECAICQLVMKYNEMYLGKNASADQIDKFLDQICPVFPVGASECESLVKQYRSELVSFIQSYLPPEEACQMIGLCPKGWTNMKVAAGNV